MENNPYYDQYLKEAKGKYSKAFDVEDKRAKAQLLREAENILENVPNDYKDCAKVKYEISKAK